MREIDADQEARIKAARAAGWTVEPYTRYRANDPSGGPRFESDDFDTAKGAWEYAADQHEWNVKAGLKDEKSKR